MNAFARPPLPEAAWPASTTRAGVVYAADFRVERDATYRVVEEAKLAAELGFDVGLLHLPSPAAGAAAPIIPAVDRLVSAGTAGVVRPSEPIRTPLCVLAAPDLLASTKLSRPLRLIPDQTVAILDRPATGEELDAIQACIERMFGDVKWSATRADLLALLRSSSLPLLGSLWHSWSFAGRIERPPGGNGAARPLIGCCAGPGAAHWPATEGRLQELFDTRLFRVRLMGEPPTAQHSPEWQVLKPYERSPARFVSALDAFCYYPEQAPEELPSVAIGAALSLGVPVFLPPYLRPAIGRGPDYVELPEAPARIVERVGGGRRESSAQFDAGAAHAARLRRLAGRPRARVARAKAGDRRVAMVPTGGVGIGHVVRLVAIARRFSADVEPVFLSMSPCLSAIGEAGFHGEYLAQQTDAAPSAASWIGEQVVDFIDRHRPKVLVFDGNNPPLALVSPIAVREEISLVWVRRGMWRPSHDASALAKSRYFDLVIEPRDLAECLDQGATRARQEETIRVDPIRCLDAEEMLPRPAACAALTLEPGDTNALIQIGSPLNRDTVTLTDQIVAAASAYPGLRLANLEWSIAESSRELWPEVLTVSGFPIARYYNAFDFCISAGGYNSFHELISAGLPTLFVPNDGDEMDDQEARASFAESQGAALSLSQKEFAERLGQSLDILMDADRRRMLAENTRRLHAANGAAQAAAIIERLCR
jgi:hypothetical protein